LLEYGKTLFKAEEKFYWNTEKHSLKQRKRASEEAALSDIID